ncbi:nitroreductase family protein [Slackia exigua]|uniref:nitroreductase family protein n=1 Tax=Slackia exigua TaxID=84109 RepID=UPI002002FB0A|nr:nitroreductase family protein [Slackia exigua]MCK6139809.1 nitroreductase family protein [Slackia exigua]
MEFMKLAAQRYSVRKFSDAPVEPEKLSAVLEAGNVAPTAKNLQPQRIYVLNSAEAFEKVDGLTRCRFDAPVVLLIAYDADEDWKNPLEEGIHAGQQDASIVATHIMLAATEAGLGTCWVNLFPNSQANEAFDLPESIVPVLLMPIGYAALDAKPSRLHDERKPLEETVTYV